MVKRFKAGISAEVTARTEGGQRLIVATQNVQRLRIARSDVPMVDATRSIVLLLDGQPLEWTAGSKVEEFERSENGRWQPAPREP